MKDIKYTTKDYTRAFEFKMHPPFLIGQLFAEGYRNIEPFFFCQDGWFKSFFSNASISITSKKGIEIYSDTKKFEKLISDFNKYETQSRAFFEKSSKKDSLTKTETVEFFEQIRSFWIYFQQTEFIYLDSAYKYSLTDKVTAENLSRFGDFKYKAREYMNLVLYTGPNYFKKILEIIAKQLYSDYETVSNCSREQLLDMYDGNIPEREDIHKKKDSYAFFKEDGEIKYLIGRESRKMIDDFVSGQTKNRELRGTIVSKGLARGRVRLLITETFDDFDELVKKIQKVESGDIIVAETTTPEFTPAMTKASAILTAQGGLMSHAAIISRELKTPCIVGITEVTRTLKDGDMVEVDANTGKIKILKTK